ncbi:MAG: DUF5615 family PIN-like protein [Alphaproteobacteria bacterium]|nr:DUF5615 family PIN-like protein [Alphaproteobacteria bacterium]
MRFLVDECFPKRLVIALRNNGHDVEWVSEVCRANSDTAVLARTTSEKRIVITEDRDYGDLTIRDGMAAFGIVIVDSYFQPAGIDRAMNELCDRIDALDESLIGALTVISPSRVRQRKLD